MEMERIIIAIVSGIVLAIAKPTVVPLLRLIARPCKPFWAYKENFKELDEKAELLRLKKEELSIGDVVQPPEEVSIWQDEVNTIRIDISRLRDERETLRGFSAYFNVKKSYTHRRRVAQKLKEAKRLKLRLKNSKDLWKYKIQIQNLKKNVDDLTDEERRVLAEIKEGERPLPNVGIWLEKVVTIDTGLINLLYHSNHHGCQNNRNDFQIIRYLGTMLLVGCVRWRHCCRMQRNLKYFLRRQARQSTRKASPD